jgi:glycosyltransferase involved in cell wall biosynthesis
MTPPVASRRSFAANGKGDAQYQDRSDDRETFARPARHVCMVTHSFYESDNRVIRYAETLAQRGDSVDVFALRRSSKMPKEEVISGVRVFRIQDRFGKTEKSKLSFLWPLLRFMMVASWQVMRRQQSQGYDLVHIHNIPDFIVFAAWYPKLRGARVILDIHDIVPELFTSKFGTSKQAILISALKMIERVSAAFADHVIIANHLWLEKYTARSAPAGKCSVFVNNVDSRVFHPLPRSPGNGKLVVLFPGGLQRHQGVDVAIRAFDKLRHLLPQAEFHIYGDGIAKPELVALTAELGLNDCVRFFDPLRLHEITEVMAKADLGVVPKRADSFGNEAYSTKIMEFMSVGVPVVVSGTKVDRFYFDDSVVRFFESSNVDALSEAMHSVLTNPDAQRKMVASALEYVKRNSWDTRKADYLELVDSLCAKP